MTFVLGQICLTISVYSSDTVMFEGLDTLNLVYKCDPYKNFWFYRNFWDTA